MVGMPTDLHCAISLPTIQITLFYLPHSRRADKAGGKSVSFSIEPAKVHIVEIGLAEWRGKRMALKSIAQNVHKHMQVWVKLGTSSHFGMRVS